MRRRSLIQIYLLAAMTLAVEVPPGLARSEPQATERCADPAYRDFDFWLGHWRVDNGGLLLQLDGGIEGESMILSGTRTDRDGERVTDRITGTPLEQGKVRQLWESPRDGGETWKTLFEGIYSPAGGDDDEVGEGGGQSGYEIELKTVEPQPTLSVRAPTSVGQIAVTIAERTRMVWRYLRETGATAAGPPFTRYHEIGEEEVDLEVGFPVDQPLEGDGVLEAGELPGGAGDHDCTPRTLRGPGRSRRGAESLAGGERP